MLHAAFSISSKEPKVTPYQQGHIDIIKYDFCSVFRKFRNHPLILSEDSSMEDCMELTREWFHESGVEDLLNDAIIHIGAFVTDHIQHRFADGEEVTWKMNRIRLEDISCLHRRLLINARESHQRAQGPCTPTYI